MPPTHDAFGRPTGQRDAPAPRGRGDSGQAAVGTPPRNPRRPGWRLPYLLVLLAVGAGGVALTLSAASDWAADQPGTHQFALERDPFGPRSLLRPEALRRSIDIALADARPDERVAALSARPGRVLVTLTDTRDQARWVNVDTAGELRIHELRSSSYISTMPLARATADPGPAAEALREHWQALQPYARDPSLSAMIDSDAERISGWIASVDGVGRDDRTLRLDPAGEVVR